MTDQTQPTSTTPTGAASALNAGLAGCDLSWEGDAATMTNEELRAAGALCQEAHFAACYWDTPNGRVFGLRSVEGEADVSLIAAQYGGGGISTHLVLL